MMPTIFLYVNNTYRWFYGKRIQNPNTHGTGCTLSSAIASNLAKGFDLETSVCRAKDYISGALSAMLDLGKGAVLWITALQSIIFTQRRLTSNYGKENFSV